MAEGVGEQICEQSTFYRNFCNYRGLIKSDAGLSLDDHR